MANASILILAISYLAGGFVMLAWMACIDRHDVRQAFWAALLWPATLLAVLLWSAIDAVLGKLRWNFNIQYQPDLSTFGFRRRPVGGAGWAVRCFGLEFQVWEKDQEESRND